jgi:hypothetical protein
MKRVKKISINTFNDVLQKSFNRAGLVEKADLDFVQMIYGVEVF